MLHSRGTNQQLHSALVAAANCNSASTAFQLQLSALLHCSHVILGADHYQGITENWDAGLIYCIEVPARLIVHMLGVIPTLVQRLPMNTPVTVRGEDPLMFLASFATVGDGKQWPVIHASTCWASPRRWSGACRWTRTSQCKMQPNMIGASSAICPGKFHAQLNPKPSACSPPCMSTAALAQEWNFRGADLTISPVHTMGQAVTKRSCGRAQLPDGVQL